MDSRRVRQLFFLLVPPAYGLLALAFPMDANWDLRNYHWYNAYSFLTGRHGFDLGVASVPTFFNPILDVPFFLAAGTWPARLVAFLLGTVQGLNALPLFGIAEATLRGPDTRFRSLLPVLLATLGVLGTVTLSLVGTTFYDNVVTLGPLCALWLVVARYEFFVSASPARAGLLACGIGVLCGLVAGLKQPSVIYGVGVAAALLALPASPSRRVLLFVAFGMGAVAGTMVTGGYWAWFLWQTYGNPLFPFYNDIFRSPMALYEDYKKVFYLPKALLPRVFFPFVYARDWSYTSDAAFADHRILFCFVAVSAAFAVAAVRGLKRRRAWDGLGVPAPTRAVLFFMAGTYAAWVSLFGIYRYALALEMLAPLTLVLACGLLPGPKVLRAGGAAIAMAAAVATSSMPDWGREPWASRWVDVRTPQVPEPNRSLVLMAGHEPLAFLISGFDPAIRFIRVHGGFTEPAEPMGFNTLVRKIIAEHDGPFYVLDIPSDRGRPERYLGEYGLVPDWTRCQPVRASIEYEPYELCEVRRSG